MEPRTLTVAGACFRTEEGAGGADRSLSLPDPSPSEP